MVVGHKQPDPQHQRVHVIHRRTGISAGTPGKNVPRPCGGVCGANGRRGRYSRERRNQRSSYGKTQRCVANYPTSTVDARDEFRRSLCRYFGPNGRKREASADRNSVVHREPELVVLLFGREKITIASVTSATVKRHQRDVDETFPIEESRFPAQINNTKIGSFCRSKNRKSDKINYNIYNIYIVNFTSQWTRNNKSIKHGLFIVVLIVKLNSNYYYFYYLKIVKTKLLFQVLIII